MDVFKYCVYGPDGKLYCIDPVTDKFYVFDKKEVTAAQINNEILGDLIKKVVHNNDKATD